MPSLTLSDFDYDLPDSLIAQHPSAERSHSRLLHLDSLSQLHDRQFKDIVDILRPDDLLVFNNTKVIKARLYGEKSTGGKVEVLVERIISEREVLAHIRSSKSPKPGSILTLAQNFDVEVTGREGELFCLTFPDSVLTLLEEFGALPLPPYITHSAEDDDESRYQTVYAKHPGAIAAPTAGLHFDERLLQELEEKGINTCFVTLHVGAGTFQPVRHENLAEHVMHKEVYEVGLETIRAIEATRQRGGRVIAVGTTSVRALESAAAAHFPLQETQGDTQLFITPGFEFKVIDALITNFHLPKSTLLMLISALAGIPAIKHAYTHAIEQQYRFFSYGDAMFIEKPSQQ